MPEEPRVPDFFADGVKVNAGPFGYTLTLFLSDATVAATGDRLGRPIARVRIAPELARALAATLNQAPSPESAEMSAAGVPMGEPSGQRG